MTQVLPDEVKNRRSGPRPPDGRSEHPEATVRLLSQDRSRNCLRFMGMVGTLDPHGWLVERPPPTVFQQFTHFEAATVSIPKSFTRVSYRSPRTSERVLPQFSSWIVRGPENNG